jgi:hypothetical protein
MLQLDLIVVKELVEELGGETPALVHGSAQMRQHSRRAPPARLHRQV